jgi:hypothetical protein
MPLQATSGAASYDAFGGGAAAEPTYIEQIFSTFLYTGNGSTQTINNGIDLAGKGGLVWIKQRSGTGDNILTVAGNGLNLSSNSTTDFINDGQPLFNSSGFNLVSANATYNASSQTYASWTFRGDQQKFFDVVTYTGSGANRTIAHNLGSEPGCIIIKSTNRNSTDWAVYHRSLGNTQYIRLNTTGAAATSGTYWNNTTPTSTVFSLGTSADVNNSGGATYVAYLFAHDSGGFGLTGTDNVISCGSYTTDASYIGPNVNLGYEPQWILVKNSSANGAWYIIDNMRGWESGGNVTLLNPNTSSEESTTTQFKLNATGFQDNGAFAGDATMIYIAIRRGPMKVPTTGTSVFALANDTTGVSAKSINAGFPTDMVMQAVTEGGSNYTMTRLIGSKYLRTQSTAAESSLTSPFYVKFDQQNTLSTYVSDQNNAFWNFRRAPGFMDVCCYTGTGSARTVAHNLAAVPELMIVKGRNLAQEWDVYVAPLGATKYLRLDSTLAANVSSSLWNNTTPTSTNFTVGTDAAVNANTYNYVAYLFSSVAGVSKVGSYTGTGTTLQIDCGFTGGARFVLIKRTDDDGFAWYVWDSARGIVAGNDPYLLLNSTAAEVTNTDYVDTASTGFEISSTAPAAINASGGTFVFLAIA